MSYLSCLSSSTSKCWTVPTDTPERPCCSRLEPPPPPAGCPFSSSGPVFLFAFYLSPKQHWHAFQRWHDTFFTPQAPRARLGFRFRNCVTHTLTHARTFLTFTRYDRRASSSRALFRSHLSDPGHGLVWFLFVSPTFFYYCAASTIFFY